MNPDKQIEIKLDKSKLVLMILGSVVFVGLGVWLLFDPLSTRIALFNNPTFVKIAGASSILFFGLCLISMAVKLGDKKPGLIISDTGIMDNSGGISAGNIPWDDILEIRAITVFNARLLMIIVTNPEYYISRETNMLKRKTKQINYKNYGSPISISANTLDCNFDELKNILDKKFGEFLTNRNSNFNQS
jgi:hypothetical protein